MEASDDTTRPAAPPPPPRHKPRGFAAMPRERVIELGRKGGTAAHEAGTAHEFSRAEAREAGRKGGLRRAKQRAENTG